MVDRDIAKSDGPAENIAKSDGPAEATVAPLAAHLSVPAQRRHGLAGHMQQGVPGIIRHELVARREMRPRVRKRCALLRDVVRLCRRVTLGQRMSTFMHWPVEHQQPSPLLMRVIRTRTYLKQVEDLASSSAQPDVDIAVQWCKCLRLAFPSTAFAEATEKLEHCFAEHDLAAVSKVPMWMLSRVT